MTITRVFHSFATAVQFLTRVPLPGGMSQPGADITLLRSAVMYFPLVGAGIGLATGSLIWLTLQVWPPFVAIGLGLVFEAMLTGGFHEDAVADSCDAFGGGWTADDVLRIMKDSRIGSFGALGLLLAVGLRATSLASLEPAHVILTTMASAALGRWAILLLMATVPPVPKRDSLAKDVGEQIGWREVAIGSLLALPGIAGYAMHDPQRLVIAIFAVVVITFVWGRYVRWRIGGVTGDCLGALCYAAQVTVLLVACAK